MAALRIVITGAIVILATGCGPSEVDQMIEQTKKQGQPVLVKKAALPMFSLAGTNLIPSSLPKEISLLPLFGGHPEEIQCWRQTTNALVLMTGGGFGHWGLIICKEQPQPHDTQGLHAVVKPWAEGVFFFKER